MRKSTGIAVVGLAVALSAGTVLGAHEVSTVQGLVDALTAINSGASTDLTVRLAPGTYDWPEGATDLAGNPRICTKYGRPVVDIGCYECWIPQLGTSLLFR